MAFTDLTLKKVRRSQEGRKVRRRQLNETYSQSLYNTQYMMKVAMVQILAQRPTVKGRLGQEDNPALPLQDLQTWGQGTCHGRWWKSRVRKAQAVAVKKMQDRCLHQQLGRGNKEL